MVKLNIAKLSSVHHIIQGRKHLMARAEFRSSILPCTIVMLRKHVVGIDVADGIEMKMVSAYHKDLCTLVRQADSFDDAWSMSYLMPQLLDVIVSLLGDDKTIVQYTNHNEVIEELKGLML